MKKVFDLEASSAPSGASVAVLACPGIQLKKVCDFLVGYGINIEEVVLISGDAMSIVMPDEWVGREFILGQIERQRSRHRFVRLLVVMHTGCSVCNGSPCPSYYETLLYEAVRVLQDGFPQLEIAAFLFGSEAVHLVEMENASLVGA